MQNSIDIFNIHKKIIDNYKHYLIILNTLYWINFILTEVDRDQM